MFGIVLNESLFPASMDSDGHRPSDTDQFHPFFAKYCLSQHNRIYPDVQLIDDNFSGSDHYGYAYQDKYFI